MHRRHLTELLSRYRADHPDEAGLAQRFLTFTATHDDCLERTCQPGHITASCWILTADHRHCLLTHHRKLGRWLQLGGHVDGEGQVERAALREAQEESGMQRFRWPVAGDGRLRVLDLDVHPIPARGAEPAHDHWDVRFLLVAEPDQALRISAESNDLRWCPVDGLAQYTAEQSVLRLQTKAVRLLAAGGSAILALPDRSPEP